MRAEPAEKLSGRLFPPIRPAFSAHPCQASTECRDNVLCVTGRGLGGWLRTMDTHRGSRELMALGPKVPSVAHLGNQGVKPHNRHFGAKGIP